MIRCTFIMIMLVLDTVSMAKVLANKDESKCLKPLIAVIRPVRDRYIYDQVFINQAGDD